MSPATSGSARRRSRAASRAVAGSLSRSRRPSSTRASINAAVMGDTLAGGSYSPRATTAFARSMTALRSFSGTDPCPPAPRVRMRNCANAFSPTASKTTLRPSTGSHRPPMPSLSR